MKTLLRLTLLTFISTSLFSCTKTIDKEWSSQNAPAAVTEPSVSAKIYDYTTQPALMNLGSPAAIVQEGNKVTIFVPYGIVNDKVNTATLTVKDASLDEVIGTYNLLPNTNSAAAQLVVPTDLKFSTFMFATFTIDGAYVGKTVNLYTNIAGSKVNTEDSFENAFSVLQ
jgi:hypothetical protein